VNFEPWVNEEVWLHVPTMTTAAVRGNYGEFYWNGKREESFWGIFRQEASDNSEWQYIGPLWPVQRVKMTKATARKIAELMVKAMYEDEPVGL
jgi:hypothetical protein